MKTARNISGIFVLFLNKETRKWENRCFEDLPEENQDEFLETKSIDWIKDLAKMLGRTLNEIGDKFDIKVE